MSGYICTPVVTKEIRTPVTPWFADEPRDAINKKNAILNHLKKERANVLWLEQCRNVMKQVKSLKVNKKTLLPETTYQLQKQPN